MIACVIPVHGREALLWYTIQRLKRQSGPVSVLCVGQTESERVVCEAAGAVFLKHRNHPLGEKWQYGLNWFRGQPYLEKIEAFLFLGSSDWISDHWCEAGLAAIKYGGELVGMESIHFLHVFENNLKDVLYWSGYDERMRRGEFIGTGRMYGRRLLDRLDWQLFDKTADSGMDYHSLKRAKGVRAIIGPMGQNYKLHALSLSTYRWPNLHTAQGWKCLRAHPSVRQLDSSEYEPLLRKFFPEAQNLFGE